MEDRKKNERICWLDAARGIGILLVVLGHSEYIPAGLKCMIYGFHMPFFFFCSGLFAEDSLDLSPGAFLKKKSRAYLLPYVTCELILNCVLPFFSYPVKGMLSALAGEPMPVMELPGIPRFLGILVQWPETEFSSGLWFFTVLFNVNGLYYLLHRGGRRFSWLSPRYSVPFLAICGFLLHKKAGILLPWYPEASCLCLPFFAAGVRIGRKGLPNLETMLSWHMGLGMLILSTGASLLYGLLTGQHPDYHLSAVEEPVTAYLAGFSGIFFLCFLGIILEKSRILRFTGENSLFYFAFDWIGTKLLLKAGVLLGLPGGLMLIISAAGALFVTIPIALFFKRYLPGCFGMAKAGKALGETDR